MKHHLVASARDLHLCFFMNYEWYIAFIISYIQCNVL